MDKGKYFTKLVAIRDKISGTIQLIGHSESLGAFTRNSIPVFNGKTPLNDLEIVDLGEINPFTGEIRQEAIVNHDWKALYNFNVTNEAVKDESETAKNSDKQ